MSILFTICLLFGLFLVQSAYAVGATPQNLLEIQVPVTWCAVLKSPADETYTSQSQLDSHLWKRHERPSERVWIPDAGITFRSDVFDKRVVDFQRIKDETRPPEITLAHPNYEIFNGSAGINFASTISGSASNQPDLLRFETLCWQKWQDEFEQNMVLDTLEGYRNGGIIAINLELFHEGDDTNMESPFFMMTGLGGCFGQTLVDNNGDGYADGETDTCIGDLSILVPLDSRVFVIDNKYLHSTVDNDRKIPLLDGSLSAGSFVRDPYDQALGHEFGHALGLWHLPETNALMHPTQVPSTNNEIDNFFINPDEIERARTNALNAALVESDPDGIFVPRDFFVQRVVDEIHENKNLPAHVDISSVRITLNTEIDRVIIGNTLSGLIPKHAKNLQYWTIIDVDNNPQTGSKALELEQLGLKTKLTGAEVIIKSIVNDYEVTANAWEYKNGNFVNISDGLLFDIQRLILHANYATFVTKPPLSIPYLDKVVISIDNKFTNLKLDSPFNIQTITVDKETNTSDKLFETEDEHGLPFIFKQITYPHCYPHNVVKPGDTVKIDLEGLFPNELNLHVNFGGERAKFSGKTDENGGGTVMFTVPEGTTPGVHGATFAGNNALTADCIITVVDEYQDGDEGGNNDKDYELNFGLIISIIVLIILIAIALYSASRKRTEKK